MALNIAELEQFEPLSGEWDGLLRHCVSELGIFSTADWQHLWWQAFGHAATLRLLAIRDADTLIGIWPLMQHDDILSLVGGAEVCDYLDVIAWAGREREVLEAGLSYLGASGSKHLDLRFVPAASPTVEHLPALAEQLGWTLERSVDDVCPTICLPGDWDTYLASLNKKNRHELRRKLRRLTDSGSLEWQVAGSGNGLEQDADDFLRLHRLSRSEKAAFMDDAMECFFRTILAHFRPRGQLKIYFLSLDGQRVAATLCIEHHDALWVYNSGFDRDYAPLSVGLALKAFCIQDAIACGKRKVDFLRGREPYKYDLGAQDVPVFRLTLSKA